MSVQQNEKKDIALGDDTDLNYIFFDYFPLVSLIMLNLLMNIIPFAIFLITAQSEMTISRFSMRM